MKHLRVLPPNVQLELKTINTNIVKTRFQLLNYRKKSLQHSTLARNQESSQ